MSPKQPMSDDEIFNLIRYRYCSIKGPYILAYTHGEFDLIDILNNTRIKMRGYSGAHNLSTTTIASSGDMLTMEVYDNASGELLLSGPCGRGEFGAASNGFYVLRDGAIYLTNNKWKKRARVYAKSSDKLYRAYMGHDAMVAMDFSDDELTYIFIKNRSVYKYAGDLQLRSHGVRIVSETAIILHHGKSYRLIEIDTKSERRGIFATPPVEMVLSKRGLVYLGGSDLFLESNKLIPCPNFAYWLLFEAMCAKGFENVELLSSLTSQQLFNFYRDQL